MTGPDRGCDPSEPPRAHPEAHPEAPPAAGEWPLAARGQQAPRPADDGSWRAAPTARPRGMPPQASELTLESEQVTVKRTGIGGDIRLPAADARRLAQALELGGVWGKRVTLVGGQGSITFGLGGLGAVDEDPPPYDGWHDLSMVLMIGQFGALAARLRSERTDFRYPLWLHWIILAKLR